jgi:hypothetical protein
MIVRDATRIVGALVAVARLKRCTGRLALAAEPVSPPPIITIGGPKKKSKKTQKRERRNA